MEDNDSAINAYHTGYLTDDMNLAIAFYERVFGGAVVSRTASGTGEIAFVKAGGIEVELIAPKDPKRLAGRSGLILDHIGYCVPDLDKAVAQLKRKGATFVGEPSVNARGDRLVFLDATCALGTKIHVTEKRA